MKCNRTRLGSFSFGFLFSGIYSHFVKFFFPAEIKIRKIIIIIVITAIVVDPLAGCVENNK